MIRKIKMQYWVTAYLLLNIILVISYCVFDGTSISKFIYKMSFPYSSPVLQLNAILLFIIVAKNPFKSKIVNWCASSSLAIYLIHESYIVRNSVIGPVALWIKSYILNDYFAFLALNILALSVVFVCIFIDKIFTPLWGRFQSLGDKMEKYVILKIEITKK